MLKKALLIYLFLYDIFFALLDRFVPTVPLAQWVFMKFGINVVIRLYYRIKMFILLKHMPIKSKTRDTEHLKWSLNFFRSCITQSVLTHKQSTV